MRRLILASLLVGACSPVRGSFVSAPHRDEPPTRIILLVGDGAGLAHWSGGYLDAVAEGESLAVASFPVVGLVDPGNLTSPKPESASGATAFATGVRSYFGAIGMGPDTLPRRSVLEAAESAGLATGVLTTTLIVDATPAAFLAHARTREDMAEIAAQIAAKPVEVLMGDGRGWFDGTLRGDSANLLATMRQRYAVVTSGAELRAIDPDTVQALLGFFASDAGRDPAARDPSLAEMTRAALAVLDRDPDGFFLMIENEHTDHATHENLPLAVVRDEVRALDDAVRVALEYGDRHPETLIVVAADHETGGLSLIPSEGTIRANYGWTDHTATLVPLFAIGPGAERFGGLHRNDEIGRLLMEAVVAPTAADPARHGPAADDP